MAVKNSDNHYGWVARLLHWGVGLLILAVLGVGLYMSDLPNSPEKFELYGLHKATGVMILALVVVRIFWRLMNVEPASPHGLPKLLHQVGKGNVHLLYVLMVAIPLTGLLMSLNAGYPVSVYGLLTIPAFDPVNKEMADILNETHETLAWVMIVALAAHVAGALYHHFVRRDNVLRRIICGS